MACRKWPSKTKFHNTTHTSTRSTSAKPTPLLATFVGDVAPCHIRVLLAAITQARNVALRCDNDYVVAANHQ
eukprot:4492997-Amphidinium_carterae.2